MRALSAVIAAVIATTALAAAQGTTRAWQQRLHVEVPVAVPMVQLQPANPFSVVVDSAPRLVNGEAPRKLDVQGKALVAAYVDARGECLGAVPLELPFPGMTSALLAEFTGARFEPAQVGKRAVPSWVVVELTVESKVKASEVLSQDLRMPDPRTPPTPANANPPRPSGQLMNLPFSPLSSLSETAIPKRIRLRLSGGDHDVTVRALVHITDSGRCDRYVPIDVDSGLDLWLANLLASWSLHPAQRDGQATDCWLVYTARVRFKLGGIETTTFGVVRDHAYDPATDAS